MPFNFNVDESVDEVLEELDPQDPALADEEQQVRQTNDEEMSEVDWRLELAQYYRLLLTDSLFNNDSKAASIVEKEIRQFVRSRLGELIGVSVKAPEAERPSDFNQDQVAVLKLMADKVLKKPAILDKEPVKKAETKKEVKIKAEEPSIKKVAAPVAKRQPAKEQPAPKPTKAPALAKGAPEVKQEAKPAANAKYIVKETPVDENDIPEDVKADPALLKQFGVKRKSDGSYVKVYKQSIEKQAGTVDARRKRSTQEQANAIAAQHAAAAFRAVSGSGLGEILIKGSGIE
jgi:hypothetical protein